MKRPLKTEPKKKAIIALEEIEKDEEFDDEEVPGGVAACDEGSYFRKTASREESEKKRRPLPPKSPRLQAKVGDQPKFENIYEHVDNAVRDKVIWSGERQGKVLPQPRRPQLGVSWSTGFEKYFWEKWQEEEEGWRCELKRGEDCLQPDYSMSKDGLVLGHDLGFWRLAHSNKQHLFCDGKKHWWVRLYNELIVNNQAEDRIRPQCSACNSSVEQRNRDARIEGEEYPPQPAGECPGEDCEGLDIDALTELNEEFEIPTYKETQPT